MSRCMHFDPRIPSVVAIAFGCGALALLLLAGCGESTRDRADGVTANSTSSNSAGATEAKTGKEMLQQLAAGYRQAVTYTDQGVAHVQYKLNGRDNQAHFPFSVTFAQPNRIWVKAYEGEIVSDGRRICALHESVRGYVRTAAAPEKLTVAKIYGDEFTWSALNERQAGGPLQLEFLLNEKILDSLLAAASGEPELLEPATVEQVSCQGVRLNLPQGKMVFWIQPGATPLLRRVEYPTDEIRKTLEQDGQVTDLAVTADFTGAKANEPLADDAFRFEPPAGAKEVKQFVGPAPADVLGQKPGAFEFTSLADGQKITPASLAGKVVVIDFWATWCEFCLKKMPDVAKVYEKYKANDKVRFVAVSIDQQPPKEKQAGGGPESQGASDEAIKAKLAELKLDLPIARDGHEVNGQTVFYAFSLFKVPGIPARILLGPDGTVQAGAVGLTAEGVDPVAELSGKIDALLAGKNLYGEMIAEFEKAMQQPPPEPTEPSEPAQQPEAKIAPRSEPKTVKLAPHWTCSELPQPGNLLVVADPKETTNGKGTKVFAIDAFHSVVEINLADGKIVARHALKLPEKMAISFLRTAVDGEGKRYFAASALGQPQVFVFDDAWQPLGHYPPTGVQANVGDAQFADLDGDGKLELCVGFLEKVGVHATTLQGHKLWACEKLSDVVSLHPSAADAQGHRQLWCVHAPGKATPIDPQGAAGAEIMVGQRAIRWLHSARLSGDVDALAGFAYVAPDSNPSQMTDAVVGVDLAGKDLWTYPLPTGQQPWLEQLGAGRVIGGQRHWIAAAADGSLHFVSADGQPLDHFNFGAAIAGYAAVEVDGKPLLIIASGDKLQAWHVEAK